MGQLCAQLGQLLIQLVPLHLGQGGPAVVGGQALGGGLFTGLEHHHAQAHLHRRHLAGLSAQNGALHGVAVIVQIRSQEGVAAHVLAQHSVGVGGAQQRQHPR